MNRTLSTSIKYALYTILIIAHFIIVIIDPSKAIYMAWTGYFFGWVNGCWLCLPLIPILFFFIPLTSSATVCFLVSGSVNLIFRKNDLKTIAIETIILVGLLLSSYLIGNTINNIVGSTLETELISEELETGSSDSPNSIGILLLKIRVSNNGSVKSSGFLEINSTSSDFECFDGYDRTSNKMKVYVEPKDATTYEFKCDVFSKLKGRKNYSPEATLIVDLDKNNPLHNDYTEEINLQPRNW